MESFLFSLLIASINIWKCIQHLKLVSYSISIIVLRHKLIMWILLQRLGGNYPLQVIELLLENIPFRHNVSFPKSQGGC